MFSNAKILVVDDDSTICETLAMILEEEGYLADKALCGKEAIELSRSNSYDIAIVDSRLPDIEGERLLVKFKEMVPGMTQIMMTGNQSCNTALLPVNYIPDAFFIKPINVDKLLEKIDELLQKQENV